MNIRYKKTFIVSFVVFAVLLLGITFYGHRKHQLRLSGIEDWLEYFNHEQFPSPEEAEKHFLTNIAQMEDDLDEVKPAAHASPYMELGLYFLSDGEYKKAFKYLHKSWQIYHDWVYAGYSKGALIYLAGKAQNYTFLKEVARDSEADSGDSVFAKAVLAYDAGKYTEVLKNYKSYTDKFSPKVTPDPDVLADTDYWFKLLVVDACLKLKDYTQSDPIVEWLGVNVGTVQNTCFKYYVVYHVWCYLVVRNDTQAVKTIGLGLINYEKSYPNQLYFRKYEAEMRRELKKRGLLQE